MRRITLGGPELAGFISLGTDDHVKLLFPQNAEQTAALETMVLGAGKDNGPLPEMRDYTPRPLRPGKTRAGHRLRPARRRPCLDLG